MTTDWVRLSTLLDDDALLPRAVALAATDRAAYFAEHEEALRLAGSTSPLDVDPWTALLDGLDDAGALAYLDAHDTGMEVSEAMSELPRIKEIDADLSAVSDIDDLDEAIAHLDAILAAHKLQVVYLSEDSDAYPLVVVPISHIAEVGRLAKQAGRATGASPAMTRAYAGYELDSLGNPYLTRPVPAADRGVLAVVFQPDASNPPMKPTVADANGWAHYLESTDPAAGHTAVLTGDGPNAGYLTNPNVREFVIDGGHPIGEGGLIVRIRDGAWVVERVIS